MFATSSGLSVKKVGLSLLGQDMQKVSECIKVTWLEEKAFRFDLGVDGLNPFFLLVPHLLIDNL